MFTFIFFFPNAAVNSFTALNDGLSAGLVALPTAVQPAFSSLLVALSLVSVFFFGLLLDLIGSIGYYWEVSSFRYQFEKNELWLRKLVEAEFDDYAHDDLASFLTNFPLNKHPLREFLSGFLIWRPSTWRVASGRLLGTYRALLPLRRLEYLLIAYAFEAQTGSKVDWLSEQIRLWHMSRAVSVTLYLIGLEFFGGLEFLRLNSTGQFPYVALLILGLATALPLYVTRRAYSRFCMTLFALVYAQMRWERRQHEETIASGKQLITTGSDSTFE